MTAIRRLRPFHLAGLLALAAVTVGLAACGGDDENESAASKESRSVEKAFLTGMVHHHESAIEMAKIAQDRTQDPFIAKLAGAIITAQDRETSQMRSIHQRLFGTSLKPDPGAHDGLGLSAAEAGMTHSEETNAMLRSAAVFDRAFVDEMVPHHLGAIKMAKVVRKDTNDAVLKNLAETVIRVQQNEVNAMNAFRKRKFGEPGPSNSTDAGGSKGEAEHGAMDEGH